MGSRGSGAKNDSQSIQDRINKLRPYLNHKNEVVNPLRQDTKFVTEALRRYDELSNQNRLYPSQVESVFTDRLYTKQPWLNKNKLLKYSTLNLNKDEPIKGIQYKGEVILLDGNHRAALAKLSSQSKINVTVTNLDRKRLFRKKK